MLRLFSTNRVVVVVNYICLNIATLQKWPANDRLLSQSFEQIARSAGSGGYKSILERSRAITDPVKETFERATIAVTLSATTKSVLPI
jgi:hypothetical protein